MEKRKKKIMLRQYFKLGCFLCLKKSAFKILAFILTWTLNSGIRGKNIQLSQIWKNKNSFIVIHFLMTCSRSWLSTPSFPFFKYLRLVMISFSLFSSRFWIQGSRLLHCYLIYSWVYPNSISIYPNNNSMDSNNGLFF